MELDPKDVVAVEESSPSIEEGSKESPQDAAASGEKVPWSQDKRFKEFLKEKKTFDRYKELGDPDALVTALEKSKVLDDLMKQAQEEEGSKEKSGDPKKEEREQARQALLQLLPELGHLAGAAQRMDVLVNSIERSARKETKSLMSEYGLATEKADVAEMEEILANIIKGDEELADDFYHETRSTVQKAFKKAMKKFEDAAKLKTDAAKQKDGEKLSTLPKSHPAGGGTGSKAAGEGPPKTMKDLEKAFKAAIG